MSLLSFTKKLSRKGEAAPRGEATSQPTTRRRADTATALHPVGLSLEPLLTEKSVVLQGNGVAAFRVPHQASKHQIALAVEQRYGARVRRVRILRVLPRVRRRGKTSGLTAAWKKAYVTVDDVQKIVTGP